MKTLKINKNHKTHFKNEPPIAAFKQNRILKEVIGNHWIRNRRVNKRLRLVEDDKHTLCRSKSRNICYKYN